MVFTIFIGGLTAFNSGKTTLSSQILSYFLNSYSDSVVPFKPLSGNNLYYHYAEIQQTIKKYDLLLSLDIVNLINQLSDISVELSLLNPVHRLSTPAVPYQFLQEGTLNIYYSRFIESSTLLQRFIYPLNKNTFKSIILLNKQVYENNKFLNDKSLFNTVLENADKIQPYQSEQEYFSLNSQYYAKSTNTTFEFLKKKFDIIIIEGFNDSAHPAWSVREANLIFLVGPGTLFIYEPEPYLRAVDNYRSINRDHPSTTKEVVKLQKPNKAISLSLQKEKRDVQIKQVISEYYPR